MFTKNIKTIVIVAVALVVAILVSCLVAVNNDKKVADQVAGQVQQNATDAQKKIDELNKTIADLKAALEKANAGITDANEALEAQKALIEAQQAVIDALKEAGVKVENWEAASAVMVEKIYEVQDLANSYRDYYDEETGITGAHLYGYLDTATVNWSWDYFYTPANEACYALMRCTTVEEMEAVVEALAAEFDAIPTHYEALYATLETVEADEVTYDDYANIVLATELLEEAHDAFFAPAEGETKAERVVLEERLAEIYKTFKPIVIESFETLVAALPAKAETVRMSHKDAVDAAVKEYAFLGKVLTTDDWTEARKDENFVKAEAHYTACTASYATVKGVYDAAQTLNKKLADASKADTWTIKADRATRDTFNTLYADVQTWVLGVVAAGYYDAETETFDAEVISYYDETIMAGYEAELAKVAGTMSTEAVKFINAVAAIEKVTNESKAELDACVAAYVAFTQAAGNYSPADVDYILGVEEDGVVAAWNTLAGYQKDHARILELIKNVEDYAASLLIKCTTNHGDKACDCKNIGDRNTAVAFVNHDEWIVELVGFYGLEETVIKAEALAVYKAARLEAAYAAAIKNATDAHTDSNNASKDSILANLKTFIGLAAQTEYKFEVKMVCTDPENKDHKCNCAADLANYKLVEDAATKALAVFTYDYCEGFYEK